MRLDMPRKPGSGGGSGNLEASKEAGFKSMQRKSKCSSVLEKRISPWNAGPNVRGSQNGDS